MTPRPSEVLAVAAESLDRVATVLVARLADMTAAQLGWPPSAWSDATSRGGVHWCWDHERDVAVCHEEGEACAGEVVASPGDRTGESALRRDRAAAHRREVERLIVAVARDARRIEQLVGLYSPRPASEAERRLTLADNDREPGCASCARTEVARGVARWEPVFRETQVGDELRPLCRWCYDWLRGTGSLPSADELRRHHRGERIRRPA